TGFSTGTGTGLDYATVAYNATTGAQLWVKRYNGPANSQDGGYSLAVSPDGGTVYVTGGSTVTTTTPAPGSRQDYPTTAYSPATGAQLWASNSNGPGNGQDFATSMAVSPSTGTVYVAGQSDGINTGPDYATVAYQGCPSPQTSNGHCYEAGEFCPHADAGMTDGAGNGEAII